MNWGWILEQTNTNKNQTDFNNEVIDVEDRKIQEISDEFEINNADMNDNSNLPLLNEKEKDLNNDLVENLNFSIKNVNVKAKDAKESEEPKKWTMTRKTNWKPDGNIDIAFQEYRAKHKIPKNQHVD